MPMHTFSALEGRFKELVINDRLILQSTSTFSFSNFTTKRIVLSKRKETNSQMTEFRTFFRHLKSKTWAEENGTRKIKRFYNDVVAELRL